MWCLLELVRGLRVMYVCARVPWDHDIFAKSCHLQYTVSTVNVGRIWQHIYKRINKLGCVGCLIWGISWEKWPCGFNKTLQIFDTLYLTNGERYFQHFIICVHVHVRYFKIHYCVFNLLCAMIGKLLKWFAVRWQLTLYSILLMYSAITVFKKKR